MIRPVILSGGGGTRLWPLSRSGNPKQFHRLFGDQSLLQATAQRCRSSRFHPPLISTTQEQRIQVVQQLEGAGIEAAVILLEPVARNTAPAIAAAALWALDRAEDDPLLVMPSDHLIEDPAAFHAAIDAALPSALDGKLLTFGIQPTRPHTGYGYIEAARISDNPQVLKVERFVEKPDAARAAEFIAGGNHFWNSGIFLFRPSAFLRELTLHAPLVAEQIEEAMKASTSDGQFVRPDPEAFEAAENISVDYAVMERSSEVLVLPVSFAWSDVGSWEAVREHLPSDEDGNVLQGDIVTIDVRNSMIRSDSGATVAAVGLDGILCVVTRDAVFLAPLDRADEVKQVVEELRARGNRRADHEDS
jgi:mannose-1-phosphate guanylyltransferase / mannose-6-phosphate isomerase